MNGLSLKEAARILLTNIVYRKGGCMKIKMIETTNGAEDKINVKRYVKSEIYDISSELKDIFLKMGVAEKVVEAKSGSKMEHVTENKMVKPGINKTAKREGVKKWPEKRRKIKDLDK